jgi:hypothetical protein
MKPFHTVAVGVALAALALPAAAFAHPGVYTSQQLAYEAAAPYNDACRITDAVGNDACIQDRQRKTYAVGNDGYAMAFTEGAPAATPSTLTNGAPVGRGMVNYRFLPGTWRGAANDDNRKLWMAYGPAKTDLQAHATCLGAAWDTPDNILAWQDDPFYNYIPWQKTSVGIGDEPAKWIDAVKAATGIDLAALNTPAEFKAACETFPGASYYTADTASSITSATVADAVAPLNTQVSTLQSQITQLQTGMSSLTAAKAAVDAQLAAALTPKPRALTLKLSAKKFDQGVAMVTGEPNTAVKVKALLSSANAKKLKISRTISSKSVKIDATGAALVDLGLSKKAAKAIDKHFPALKVTVEAAAGAVKKTATGTLTR